MNVPRPTYNAAAARTEARRTEERQSMCAKWDGKRFVYGKEAAAFRLDEATYKSHDST